MSETESYGKPQRGNGNGPSIPIAVVASLMSAVLAGGGGSWLTGAGVKESLARMETRLDALAQETRRIGDAQAEQLADVRAEVRAVSERLREAELRLERLAPSGGGPR